MFCKFIISNICANCSIDTTIYILLSAIIAFITAFTIGHITMPYFINYLHKIAKYQPIRDDGPKTHAAKVNTPTMGGVVIILSTAISTLLCCDIQNIYIQIILFAMISFGLIGSFDDYVKLKYGSYKGIKARTKFLLQAGFSVVICCAIEYAGYTDHTTNIFIPMMKGLSFDIGVFFIPFAVFVIVGSSNAVNLTDGLDGLAIGVFICTISVLAFIAYILGHEFYASNLAVIYSPKISQLVIFCSAIMGASFAFLWYNSKPASIIMGDVGSLSLGSVVGTLAIMLKHELLLIIIGGVFVIETLSVIIQVSYYRYTGGKRMFRMAPLHHHFEQKGLAETKIIARFWIAALICAILSFSILLIHISI